MTTSTEAGAGVEVARLHRAAQARLDDDLDLLAQLVGIDSGHDRPAGIKQVQRMIAERLAAMGAVATWDEAGVSHVLLQVESAPQRVAIITHADTVFPAGTAAARPFERDGEIARGPAVVDMKGGLVQVVCALELLHAMGAEHASVDLLIVGDEETRTTPPPFMELLQDAAAAVVLECGRPGGGYVTARKAGLWTSVIATGKAAHSGTSKAAGANAIDALAAEIVRIAQIDRDHPNVTVSTGMISGGTSVNAVPARAEAWFDIRGQDPDELGAVVAEIGSFGAYDGVALELVPTDQWPAMTPTASAQELAAAYEALAQALDAPADPVSTGGMSDGSWLSAAGVPTIDGLGPIGDADHTPDEWMDISSLPVRTALLAALLVELGRERPKREDLE